MAEGEELGSNPLCVAQSSLGDSGGLEGLREGRPSRVGASSSLQETGPIPPFFPRGCSGHKASRTWRPADNTPTSAPRASDASSQPRTGALIDRISKPFLGEG
jgi:hypothetical protein